MLLHFQLCVWLYDRSADHDHICKSSVSCLNGRILKLSVTDVSRDRRFDGDRVCWRDAGNGRTKVAAGLIG